jgi:hypothetical protein
MGGEDDEIEPALDEPSAEGESPLEDDTRGSRVMRFAKRLMDRRELAEDTKDLLSAVLNTSDKAKTEAVRLVAREVRGYLKELKLKETLVDLATSHSLEVSIKLKPLAPDAAPKKDD